MQYKAEIERFPPFSFVVSEIMLKFAGEEIWTMTYLNQFHKEAVERKLRKIEESMKSPMNSIDAAYYMKRNFEMAKTL